MPVRRRKRMDLVLPTSSMGDIAFLLIIFFILASNFMQNANIDAEHPQGEAIEEVEEAPTSVILDKDGKCYFQGAERSVAEIEELVRAAVANLPHDKRAVHLLVDRNLTRKQFLPVLEALGAAEVKVVLEGDRL